MKTVYIFTSSNLVHAVSARYDSRPGQLSILNEIFRGFPK
jgi:hypothetical protein